MAFLDQDEVLMHVPQVVLVKRGNPPKTPTEVLQGMRNLWVAVVEYLRKEPEVLKDWEISINGALEESGAIERISLRDRSYLALLDPMIVTNDSWGIAPKIFMDKVNSQKINPEVWITADDPENEDPELPFDLAENLLDPLYLPREYR